MCCSYTAVNFSIQYAFRVVSRGIPEYSSFERVLRPPGVEIRHVAARLHRELGLTLLQERQDPLGTVLGFAHIIHALGINLVRLHWMARSQHFPQELPRQ